MTKVPNAVSMVAEKFLRLIPGSDRCHATFNPDPATFVKDDKSGKLTPKYCLVEQPVTVDLWERHLAGTYPLVVALACDDLTTRCSVVDVDDYSVNPLALADSIKRTGLPLYVRRSKSGGAHVFAFHDRPVSIEQSEKISSGIARLLGLASKVEYFPRVQKPDAKPLQLNMPFCGNSGCFVKVTGAEMAPDEFLRAVKLVTDEQRASITKAASEQPRNEAPPTSDAAGRDYATAKLRRYGNELKSAVSHGNNLINKHGFHMGTMVARGWVERWEVEQAFGAAIVKWSNQPKHLKTLSDALDAGNKHPHDDLSEDEGITEDGVALAFADRHISDLRYDVDVGKWYQWSGSHWQRTNKPVAFTFARDLARELSTGQPQRVINITSRANFAGNVERFARGDWALVTEQSAWDTDLYALGTPGGVVDLRTGTLREAVPEDQITKQTAIAPADTPDCPLWLKFLHETTEGDQDLVDFLQVLCGYSLTGEVSEHLLAFVHGDGGNGKSVFVGAIAGLLGDYAIEAAPEMFVDARFDRHPTELADLRGPRFVTSSETTGGRSWNETLVKKLTGGDKIKGRFMRQDFFEFTPQFQLVIVGNEAPNLKSVGEAMRRRLVMVPFDNQPKVKDTKLSEKLRAEWPGILRWLIDGCLRWQAEGIRLPDVVKADTDMYFEEQDVFHQFVQFHLAKNQTARMSDTEIFSLWEHYATQAGADVRDKRWVNGRLRGKPYSLEDKKSNGERYFLGIKRREVRAEPAQGELYGSPDKPGGVI